MAPLKQIEALTQSGFSPKKLLEIGRGAAQGGAKEKEKEKIKHSTTTRTATSQVSRPLKITE